MMSTNGLIREVLSRHLDRASSKILPDMMLESDLHVTPLELVQVAIEVEEREDVSIPVEEMTNMQTVGDLMTFVSKSVARSRVHQVRSSDLLTCTTC